MKKVEKLKLSMTMAVCFIVALFATSCSNDDFFGFEDETTNLGLLSSQNNITSRGYIDTLDYLSISSNSTINLTANEIINLHQAINRIELLTDYGRLSRPNSGSSYNMSDTLFTLANKIIANTRSLNLLLANKNERVKDGNREGGGFVISGKDCVGQAIAKRFHLNADSINTLLAGTIPNYYTNGVPLAMMNTAFSACGVSGSLKTTLPLSDLGSYDMLLLDMLNNQDYHAMNITSISYANQKYTIIACDKNNFDVYFTLNRSNLPSVCEEYSNLKINCYYVLSK
jgi:hypothetical protein